MFIKELFSNLEIRGHPRMPVCEICGMEVVQVHECSKCEAKFCDECGDLGKKLCYDCMGWEDEEIDESGKKVNDWDDGWNDDEPH